MPQTNTIQDQVPSNTVPTETAYTQERRRQDQIAQEIIMEYQQISINRGNFETHWQEIAQRIIPQHFNAFNPNAQLRTQGEKRTEFLFDSTAMIALGRFASILDSLLTPRNQTWHRLMPDDEYLMKNREARLWFEDANRTLFKYRYAPKANFSSQNQQNYTSLGAYGTGCMFTDQLSKEPGLRYKNIHLGQIFFIENHQGIIDKAIRYYALTARQAIQMWGEDAVSPSLLTSYKNTNDSMKQFYFIHCVKPREDRDPERLDFKGMEYASYYVSMEGRKLLSEGGYNTFPYAISRYEQSDNEVYGRSPAMNVLPTIKTLNEEKKTMLKQGHRAVDPVLLIHDDGMVDSFSLKPGAINSGGVTADGRVLVHPLPVGNMQVSKEMMDEERETINDAFLVNIFQILTENPQMTATEVMERTREKGILLAPTIGRQQSEYLGPLIERELDVLARQRLLPKMPPILLEAGASYKIEYDSPLSRAQRAEEASGLMRTIESVLQVVQTTMDPTPLDFFDWDTIVPEVADIQGVPPKWMRSLDQVQVIRNNRGQQQQAQQVVQAAPAAAAMVKAGAAAKKVGGI